MTRTSSTFVLMLGLWWLWHTHLLEVISLRNPWVFFLFPFSHLKGGMKYVLVREGKRAYPQPFASQQTFHPPEAAPSLSYHNRSVAVRAPSTIAASFAQVMSGSTVSRPAKVAKPQSVPAMTFSRPTTEA